MFFVCVLFSSFHHFASARARAKMEISQTLTFGPPDVLSVFRLPGNRSRTPRHNSHTSACSSKGPSASRQVPRASCPSAVARSWEDAGGCASAVPPACSVSVPRVEQGVRRAGRCRNFHSGEIILAPSFLRWLPFYAGATLELRWISSVVPSALKNPPRAGSFRAILLVFLSKFPFRLFFVPPRHQANNTFIRSTPPHTGQNSGWPNRNCQEQHSQLYVVVGGTYVPPRRAGPRLSSALC